MRFYPKPRPNCFKPSHEVQVMTKNHSRGAFRWPGAKNSNPFGIRNQKLFHSRTKCLGQIQYFLRGCHCPKCETSANPNKSVRSCGLDDWENGKVGALAQSCPPKLNPTHLGQLARRYFEDFVRPVFRFCLGPSDWPQLRSKIKMHGSNMKLDPQDVLN